MSIPTPQLDDRKFQQIVDEAKRMIPKYCPEWTDHNVSDPGIALIEIFAWMTEMLLYRVNQVPEKMYCKFLEFIGLRLSPPRSAIAPVTFYLSGPLEKAWTVNEGIEVATARTETSPAIVFTTVSDLELKLPDLKYAYTYNRSRLGEAVEWTNHEVSRFTDANFGVAIFPPSPSPGDGFYLGFETDVSHHVIALVVNCENASGVGVDWDNAPITWQVGQSTVNRWADCEVEYDGTRGFNVQGDREIILRLPRVDKREAPGLKGVSAYWLRCELTKEQASVHHYNVPPKLHSLRAQTRGGTVDAENGIAVYNELLGRSDATPGQVFTLLHSPVLKLDVEHDFLLVESQSGATEEWRCVGDFADSKPEDRHFVLDTYDAQITLGPSLRQPDGKVYQFGAIPAKDSVLRFKRYQYGGGVEGNVAPGSICVSKTEIPYVARVTNHAQAIGGKDSETLDAAKLRVPQYLRTITRAVTADDHEFLACTVNGVARACCLGAGQPGSSGPQPGQAFVYILPSVEAPDRRIAQDQLTLSADLITNVKSELSTRRLLGVSIEVREPNYQFVAVEAHLVVSKTATPGVRNEVQHRAEMELYRYLNPFVGGPDGTGWPFGRSLYRSEVFAVLQRIPMVEFVREVRMTVTNRGVGVGDQEALINVEPSGLVCSDTHSILVDLNQG